MVAALIPVQAPVVNVEPVVGCAVAGLEQAPIAADVSEAEIDHQGRRMLPGHPRGCGDAVALREAAHASRAPVDGLGRKGVAGTEVYGRRGSRYGRVEV